MNQAYCFSQGVKGLARKCADHSVMLDAKDDALKASSALAARRTNGMRDGKHN